MTNLNSLFFFFKPTSKHSQSIDVTPYHSGYEKHFVYPFLWCKLITSKFSQTKIFPRALPSFFNFFFQSEFPRRSGYKFALSVRNFYIAVLRCGFCVETSGGTAKLSQNLAKAKGCSKYDTVLFTWRTDNCLTRGC